MARTPSQNSKLDSLPALTTSAYAVNLPTKLSRATTASSAGSCYASSSSFSASSYNDEHHFGATETGKRRGLRRSFLFKRSKRQSAVHGNEIGGDALTALGNSQGHGGDIRHHQRTLEEEQVRAVELHQAYFEALIAKKAQELALVSEFVVQEVSRRATTAQDDEAARKPCSRASLDADSVQRVPCNQETEKRVLSPEAFAPSTRSRRRTLGALSRPEHAPAVAAAPFANHEADAWLHDNSKGAPYSSIPPTKTWYDQPTPAFHKPFFSRTPVYTAPSSPPSQSSMDTCGAGGLSPRPRRSRMFGKAAGPAETPEVTALDQIRSVEEAEDRSEGAGQSYNRSSSIAPAEPPIHTATKAPRSKSLSIVPHGSPLARLLAELHGCQDKEGQSDYVLSDVAASEQVPRFNPHHSLYQSASSSSMAHSASGESDLQSCVSAMSTSSLSPTSPTFSDSSFSTPMSSVGQFFPADSTSSEALAASAPPTWPVEGDTKVFESDIKAIFKLPSPSMMYSHESEDAQEEVEELLQEEHCEASTNTIGRNGLAEDCAVIQPFCTPTFGSMPFVPAPQREENDENSELGEHGDA